jgi:hypothetical protein
MSIFDVLLNTEDIVVLGPPKNIDLSLDVGPSGQRGTKIFVGSGDPNNSGVIPNGEEIFVGDFFINSSTSSKYSWMYVYSVQIGGTSWSPVLKLQPTFYSKNIQTAFTSGSANISIPLFDIISDLSIVDANRYVVSVTPISTNPIALSVSNKSITYSSSESQLSSTIQSASGNGTNVIFTTTAPHNFLAGETVSITGVNPINYTFTSIVIASTPSITQFVVQNTTTATYVSGGTARVIRNPSSFNFTVNAATYSSSSWSDLTGAQQLAISISVV